MNTHPLVINQQIEPNSQPLISLKNQPLHHNFISLHHRDSELSNAQSYGIVIEQSLTTNDQVLLKEILNNNDQVLIQNSCQSLNSSKVSSLLKALEAFVNESVTSQQKINYSLWLASLIKAHLPIILANPDNKICVQKIRKMIQQNVKSLCSLTLLQNKLGNSQGEDSRQKMSYEPKFHYTSTDAGQQFRQNADLEDGEDMDIEQEEINMEDYQ